MRRRVDALRTCSVCLTEQHRDKVAVSVYAVNERRALYTHLFRQTRAAAKASQHGDGLLGIIWVGSVKAGTEHGIPTGIEYVAACLVGCLAWQRRLIAACVAAILTNEHRRLHAHVYGERNSVRFIISPGISTHKTHCVIGRREQWYAYAELRRIHIVQTLITFCHEAAKAVVVGRHASVGLRNTAYYFY